MSWAAPHTPVVGDIYVVPSETWRGLPASDPASTTATMDRDNGPLVITVCSLDYALASGVESFRSPALRTPPASPVNNRRPKFHSGHSDRHRLSVRSDTDLHPSNACRRARRVLELVGLQVRPREPVHDDFGAASCSRCPFRSSFARRCRQSPAGRAVPRVLRVWRRRRLEPRAEDGLDTRGEPAEDPLDGHCHRTGSCCRGVAVPTQGYEFSDKQVRLILGRTYPAEYEPPILPYIPWRAPWGFTAARSVTAVGAPTRPLSQFGGMTA